MTELSHLSDAALDVQLRAARFQHGIYADLTRREANRIDAIRAEQWRREVQHATEATTDDRHSPR
jgi:hypothetical protein